MSLRLKPRPPVKQIKSGKYEVIWPGDTAVDLETSDLRQWILDGEKAGLSLKEGVEVDTIRMIPIGQRAMGQILPIIHQGSVNQFIEAFRFSCVRIPDVELTFTTSANVRCLDDYSLDYLVESDELTMELPWNLLLKEFFETQGMTVDWSEEKDKSLIDTPLVMCLGAQALIRSFRSKANNR